MFEGRISAPHALTMKEEALECHGDLQVTPESRDIVSIPGLELSRWRSRILGANLLRVKGNT